MKSISVLRLSAEGSVFDLMNQSETYSRFLSFFAKSVGEMSKYFSFAEKCSIKAFFAAQILLFSESKRLLEFAELRLNPTQSFEIFFDLQLQLQNNEKVPQPTSIY